MKNGTLIYAPSMGRFDILYAAGNNYGGLHCGTIMEVLISEKWIPTRIEYADDWYLIGIPGKALSGLTVRI